MRHGRHPPCRPRWDSYFVSRDFASCTCATLGMNCLPVDECGLFLVSLQAGSNVEIEG